MMGEKDMKRESQGATDEIVDLVNGVVICTWCDNKRVITASNFVGKEPIGLCSRYDRKEQKCTELPRPASIETYNQYMGGVDKAYMMLSLYKTKCRIRKWYHCIFIHLLHLAVVNSWVIYQEVGGRGNLLDFFINISRCLMNNNDSNDFDPEPVAKRRASVKANQVPNEIRKDKTDHWPLQIEATTQRCKFSECKRRTRFIYSKCQVTLCYWK